MASTSLPKAIVRSSLQHPGLAPMPEWVQRMGWCLLIDSLRYIHSGQRPVRESGRTPSTIAAFGVKDKNSAGAPA